MCPDQPIRSWSHSYVVWGWWAGQKGWGCRDLGDSRGSSRNQRVTPQCCGEGRPMPENGSGSPLRRRGSAGKRVRSCGVMTTRRAVTRTAMMAVQVNVEQQGVQ